MSEASQQFVDDAKAKKTAAAIVGLIFHTPPGEAFEHGYTWKEHAEDSDGCLIMIAETLERLGCCHGYDSHKNTPPMMYNDWIVCAIAKREKRIRELEWRVWQLEQAR